MLEARTLSFTKPVMATAEAYLQTISTSLLQDAMRYSLEAGGKRLRPLLLLAVVDTFGGDVEACLPAAAGLECLHTYSLIHDDLPAMDNDDLRRGQPTSHKRFGEAMAILAGDALQSAAFELLAQTRTPPERLAQALALFAQAVGASGMVGGQVLDIQGEQQHLSLPELKHLHALKTGALIQVAASMGAVFAGVDAKDTAALHDFAAAFGVAFQIQDDINDVTKTSAELGKTANKDVAEHKNTYPGLLGLSGAYQALDAQVAQAQAALARLSRPAPQLRAFLTYLDTEHTR